MYCQTFSTGFSSGDLDGSRMAVMFLGIVSLLVVCQPARSISTTAWALRATCLLISSRCSCVASLLAVGRTKAAPVPRFGQMAPNR